MDNALGGNKILQRFIIFQSQKRVRVDEGVSSAINPPCAWAVMAQSIVDVRLRHCLVPQLGQKGRKMA